MARKSFPLSISITRMVLSLFVRGRSGFENIPQGPCVIAANHSSLIDGMVLATEFAWATYCPLHMISIARPFEHPLFGWFLRSARCIPLRKASTSGTREMMRTSLAYLAMGEAVGILPEGHLGSRRRLRRMRPGVALLALESGAPIIPVGILGSYDILPLGAKRPKFRRGISLKVGAPMTMKELSSTYHQSEVDQRRELIATILDQVGKELARLCDKEPPRASRRRGQGRYKRGADNEHNLHG